MSCAAIECPPIEADEPWSTTPDDACSAASADSASLADARDTAEPGFCSLRTLCRTHRWRLLVTYAVFNLENVAMLATPWALGYAIDGLLHSSARGLVFFGVQQFLVLLLGATRRLYDARVFSRIYSDLATRLVLKQRGQNVEVSRVAARSALSREVVNFFERDVPFALQALYATVGGLVMLLSRDPLLLPLGLALMVAVLSVSRLYGRKTLLLNGRLNDQLEREVEMISDGSPAAIRGHYERVAGWNIRLANWEAMNFSLLDLCTLCLLGGALVRTCLAAPSDPGRILTTFGYVQMFMAGVLSLPVLVRQLSRLRDIGRRLS